MAEPYVYRNTRTGQTVEWPTRSVRLDHSPVWLLISAPEVEPEPVPTPEPLRAPARPVQADPKAAWVAYAVYRGMSEADARALSKTALMEEFGRDDQEDDDGPN
ncbi:hypothetical protein Ppa06_58200 [Planomonospora parontospora subsp. parontospora]|uniref:Uncharacterized protein n=2 Tax=Planomonospora parontospora TaxID=58119 RepID=A0AA37BMG8_9ACTN|nr:hypothetical protein [Planomonospora parontospora]GGK90265.1 hypothetical protein GCM10010126_57110 [Planomonospora parontospora]GII12022.1 hypothetical protein Ppa06_58200 [Planomonospora parontospora subsp. parontospora]